jgi:short-subunit dehydrogenase
MQVFRGSWALVTGASGGIGEAIARELGRRGANVILTARSTGKLETIANEIRAASAVETRVLSADLSTEAGIWQLLVLVDTLGVTIDHVVANAGFGGFGEFAGQSEREQLEMVMLNCAALTVLVRHFLPKQLERRRGGAMLVASTASFQPTPLYTVYGATKHFVRALGEALAAEVAGTGVSVSVLCPGPVQTGFQSRAGTSIAKAQERSVLSADDTARIGLDGYARHRVVVIPGTMNKVLAAVATAMPNRVVVPATLRMMRTKDGA